MPALPDMHRKQGRDLFCLGQWNADVSVSPSTLPRLFFHEADRCVLPMIAFPALPWDERVVQPPEFDKAHSMFMKPDRPAQHGPYREYQRSALFVGFRLGAPPLLRFPGEHE